MARYIQTAEEANAVAKALLALVSADSDKPKAAELIARLVNLGIRCSPRGVQHTVRLNAVKTAVKDLPVLVQMVEVEDPRTHKTYHALVTQQLSVVEGGVRLGTQTLDEPEEES